MTAQERMALLTRLYLKMGYSPVDESNIHWAFDDKTGLYDGLVCYVDAGDKIIPDTWHSIGLSWPNGTVDWRAIHELIRTFGTKRDVFIKVEFHHNPEGTWVAVRDGDELIASSDEDNDIDAVLYAIAHALKVPSK